MKIILSKKICSGFITLDNEIWKFVGVIINKAAVKKIKDISFPIK